MGKEHPRRLGRKVVLEALYAYEISGEDRAKVLNDAINRKSYDDKTKLFIVELFDAAMDHKNGVKQK